MTLAEFSGVITAVVGFLAFIIAGASNYIKNTIKVSLAEFEEELLRRFKEDLNDRFVARKEFLDFMYKCQVQFEQAQFTPRPDQRRHNRGS